MYLISTEGCPDSWIYDKYSIMTIDFTGLRIKAETEMGIFKKKSSQEDLGEEVYFFSQ